MTTDYSIADMMIGVRNMIEAADLRVGDQVLLLADTRSDKPTVEALNAGLRFFGAEPMILVTEPIARYGDVPQAVLEAMRASDVVIWVWPVFITFTPAHRSMGRKREESGSQLHESRMKPYHIYFEGNAGLLARDYAKFPNKVLWKLAEKVREVVAAGEVLDDLAVADEHRPARHRGLHPAACLHGVRLDAGEVLAAVRAAGQR